MKPIIFILSLILIIDKAQATQQNESNYITQEIQLLQLQIKNNSALHNDTQSGEIEYKSQLKFGGETNIKSTNSISGVIMIGDNPLSNGEIYLLESSKGVINIVDPQTIINGSFSFTNLSFNQYFFYVIPEFDYECLYYPKYLPTYSGNSYSWENSRIQPVNTGVCIFSLMNYPIPFYGENSIVGKVEYTNDYKGIYDFPLSVILLDENKTPMDFRIADKFTGEYSFKQIPNGKYFVHPEIPGIKTKDYELIVNNIENNESIDFLIDNDFIQPVIDDSGKPEIEGNYMNLTINSKITPPFICELFSLSGICAYKNLFNSGSIRINTNSLNAGIYLLKIRNLSNSYIKTEKVYINNHL